MGEIQGARAAGGGTGAGAATLLVVRGPQFEGDAVLAALGRLADPQGGVVGIHVMPDLAAAMAQPGNAPIVVLHRSAEHAVTEAMGRGVIPTLALASWMMAMASQLAVLRRHRRRITVVEAAALSDHRATGVIARLGARLGLDVIPSGPQASLTNDVLPVMADPSLVMTALARICLADSAGAQALASELDALVLGPSGSLADSSAVGTEGLADAAFAAHVGLYQDAGGIRARAENALLLDQLAHMLQQMEQAQAEAATALRLLEDNRREAPARQAAATAAQHLADRDADLERLRAALDASAHDLADTRRELAAVYASRSWRITGPMRKARLAVTKKDRPDG